MICVDVNQGWKSCEVALEMILRLQELGVAFVEQPLPKHLHDDMEWLKQKSPLPLFADESAQTPADVAMIRKGFHGVNVKLMKCGGITEGLKMVREAKKNGLQVLVGSMSETSCGILAAAQLTSLADYADLDGPMLTRNNPFQRPEYREGRLLI
jgi:L-alanine-DL-glutamate epimerase-like enolase superfamily enzyme